MTQPVPVAAYDIFADGHAKAVEGMDLAPANGALYRWLHLDLRDKHVPEWCDANLPAPAAASLEALETRPKVDTHEDGLIVTLRGVNLNQGEDLADMVALRFWLTESLVITVRRRRVHAMEEFRKEIAAGKAPLSTGAFLACISEKLVDRVEEIALELDDMADRMEEQVYDEHDQDMPNLPALRRRVIKLHRHVGPLARALERLTMTANPVLTPELGSLFRENASKAVHSVEELQEIRERLNALADHLDLVQATRLTRNSYVLSLIARVFAPLGFVVGLFGVNLGGIPGAHSPLAFAILCGLIAAFALGAFGYLKWRRWL